MLCIEIVSLWDDCLFISSVAFVQLLLVRGLVIDKVFGINKFEIIEHLDLTYFEGGLHGIALIDESRVVDFSCVDIGP